MPRILSKLRFWSNKSCQACKGQPTPPPCYNCVLKLETPPPAFTSVQGHFFSEDDQSSLYPFAEEYTYPEDAQIGEELLHPGNGELCHGRSSPFNEDGVHQEIGVSDYTGYELPRELGNVALAFLPDDQKQQHQAVLGVHTHGRTRHPSAPVHSKRSLHSGVPRVSSASRLEYLIAGNDEDDRETLTSSNKSLLAALSVPIMQMEDQLLLQEPLSPRNKSPLPSQLLIPE